MTKRQGNKRAPQGPGVPDAGLFEAAMADATPLDDGVRRRYVAEEAKQSVANSKRSPRQGRSIPQQRGPEIPPEKSRQSARPQHQFDRATMRQVKQGKLTVDRKLDLHGLTQAKAHDRLIGFIDSAARSGCRCVLVITGKGVQVTERTVEGEEKTERGVLRRMVPAWLAASNLAPLVVDYQSALPKHGGDGAFYIRLRRFE